MKYFIRTLSLVIALLMVSSVFVACNNDTGDTKDTGNNSDVSDTVATTEGGLPAINWEGAEYRILGRDYEIDMFREFEIDRDEMPEDVVGVAVWNRNEAVKTKYGLDVVGTLEEKPREVAKTFLEAGDDQYDLVLLTPNTIVSYTMQGYFLNMRSLNYIDLDMDCWNQYANEQLTMGGKLYYTTSKFLLHDKHRLSVAFYNRDLAAELNIGYLETKVFDGDWVIEDLVEISKIGSAEIDGSEGMTFNDRWGVAMESSIAFSRLAYGVGFRISDMGSDGWPALVGATDRMLSCLDKVYALTTDHNTCFIWSLRPETDKSGHIDSDVFTQGRAVVLLDCMSTIDDTGKMDFAYGVLPLPKYDSEQEVYYALPDISNGTIMGIPATVNDADKAAFGIQALSEEAVDTSYYAYIETKCKLQDAYDQDVAKCLEIIFKNVVYDIAHFNDIGGLGKIVHSDLVQQPTNVYARLYSKYERKAHNEIADIKEKYASFAS